MPDGPLSLGYLRAFPLDARKMDRAVVADLGRDATAATLAWLTANQLATAQARGCALGQGYDLARPLPPDEARALVAGTVPLIPSPSPPSR